jgi:hypothetical protein
MLFFQVLSTASRTGKRIRFVTKGSGAFDYVKLSNIRGNSNTIDF